jgi:hypothetical protein
MILLKILCRRLRLTTQQVEDVMFRHLESRFQEKAVAAGQGDGEHPHRHHGGKVEGCDAGDDTERLAHRHAVDIGSDVLGDLALQKVRRADCELDDLQAALDLTDGVRQDLPMLRRDDRRQIVDAILGDP